MINREPQNPDSFSTAKLDPERTMKLQNVDEGTRMMTSVEAFHHAETPHPLVNGEVKTSPSTIKEQVKANLSGAQYTEPSRFNLNSALSLPKVPDYKEDDDDILGHTQSMPPYKD